MSDLRQQFSGFLMHEETRVESILNGHSMDAVFEEIDSILVSGDSEKIARVLGFVRDANLYRHPFRDAFHEYLVTSTIWDSFKQLLMAPDFNIRRNTIYTIGKLTNRNRAHLLADAFPFYLEKDPIHLPLLLHESVWLTSEWNWNFLDQVAAGGHYLQRWSLCQVLDDHGAPNEVLERFNNILVRLKGDSNPLVAAEATLRFERITVKLGPKLPRPEWRKEVKRIASLEPRLMFESVAMQFMRARSDYSMDEFDQYVKQLS